jgi:hypothetical protein
MNNKKCHNENVDDKLESNSKKIKVLDELIEEKSIEINETCDDDDLKIEKEEETGHLFGLLERVNKDFERFTGIVKKKYKITLKFMSLYQ